MSTSIVVLFESFWIVLKELGLGVMAGKMTPIKAADALERADHLRKSGSEASV